MNSAFLYTCTCMIKCNIIHVATCIHDYLSQVVPVKPT